MKFAPRNLSYFISITVCVLLTATVVQSNVKTPVKLNDGIGLMKFFTDKFDVYLFDADGVLWAGENVVPGAPELFNLLQYLGKEVYVISNGVQSIADFKKRLEQHGFKTEGIKAIITPGIVLAENLAKLGLSRLIDEKQKARTPHQDEKTQNMVYLVGNESLRKELDQKSGINVIGIPKPAFKDGKYEDPEEHPKGEYHAEVHPIEMDGKPVDPKDVHVMVVAMDVDFDLHEAKKALSYLQTNRDMEVYVLLEEHKGPENGVYPGVKSILALLQRTLPDDNRFEQHKFETREKLIEAIKKLSKTQVYLIGDDKLNNTLRDITGVTVVTGKKNSLDEYYKEVELKENPTKVAQVVFSLDFAFTMKKAREVLTYIKRNENIQVCATNEDHQLPATKCGEDNPVKSAIFPDVGGILAFVRAAMPGISKVQDMKVLGKPHPTMFEYLLRKPGHENAIVDGRTIFIGDSLDTDMPFGNNYKKEERDAKLKAAQKTQTKHVTPPQIILRSYKDSDTKVITNITQQIMTLFVHESGKHHLIPDLETEKEKGNDHKVPTFVTPSLGHLLSNKDLTVLKTYTQADPVVAGLIYNFEVPPKSEPKLESEGKRGAIASAVAAYLEECKRQTEKKHQTSVDMPKNAAKVGATRDKYGPKGAASLKSNGTEQKENVVTGAKKGVVKSAKDGLAGKGMKVNGDGA